VSFKFIFFKVISRVYKISGRLLLSVRHPEKGGWGKKDLQRMLEIMNKNTKWKEGRKKGFKGICLCVKESWKYN